MKNTALKALLSKALVLVMLLGMMTGFAALAEEAPVTLTIAKAAKPYKGEVFVEMSQSDRDRELLVVLVEAGGEVEQYRAKYSAGQQGPMIIPVSSDYSGTLMCRIYLDSILYTELEATLQ